MTKSHWNSVQFDVWRKAAGIQHFFHNTVKQRVLTGPWVCSVLSVPTAFSWSPATFWNDGVLRSQWCHWRIASIYRAWEQLTGSVGRGGAGNSQPSSCWCRSEAGFWMCWRTFFPVADAIDLTHTHTDPFKQKYTLVKFTGLALIMQLS